MGDCMVGIQVSKTQINATAGEIAAKLKAQFDDAVALNEFFLRTANADLLELGFTQAEIDVLKSALADLAYMKGTSFDASAFVKQLYGMGV